MWIVCKADNAYQMPSFIFSEKVRILYATLILGALKSLELSITNR